MLAFELENKNDKDEVLETYLNTVYFGRGAYGVESAAQRYFGKSASSLDLAESATLAGVIRSPSRYGSHAATSATLARRDVVLGADAGAGLHQRTGRARSEQRSRSRFAPSREAGQVAPYFVEYVKQDLIDTLGADKVYAGGLRVYTTPRAGAASARRAGRQRSCPSRATLRSLSSPCVPLTDVFSR